MVTVPRKAVKPLSMANAQGALRANASSKPTGRVLRNELRAVMCAEVAGVQPRAAPGGRRSNPRTLLGSSSPRHAQLRNPPHFLSPMSRLPSGGHGPGADCGAAGENLRCCRHLARAAASTRSSAKRHGTTAARRVRVLATAGCGLAPGRLLRGGQRLGSTCSYVDRGSPCDSVADLMLVLVFHLIHLELFATLSAVGLVEVLELDGAGPFGGPACGTVEVPLRPPTYMDDLVIPLRNEGPDKLLTNVVRAAKFLVESMARYGLIIIFAAGKTKGIVFLSGRGLAAARARLWEELPLVDGVPALQLACKQQLRIVKQYKHLGITTTASRSVDPVLTARLAGSRTATATPGQRTFGSSHLPDATKAHLAAATMASQILHGAGTWSQLTGAAIQEDSAAATGGGVRQSKRCTLCPPGD
jgi:hypothetical protein